MTESKGSITIDGKTVDLSIKKGSVGPDVIDIRSLYGATGMFTYDPALPRPPAANPKSPISTATMAFCCIAAIRSSSLPNMATF